MEFINQLFGNHSLEYHIAGLMFTFIGSLIAKYHFYQMHRIENLGINQATLFDTKLWIKQNLEDVLVTLAVTFVFVRFAGLLAEMFNPKLEAAFNVKIPLTDDYIFYYFIGGIFVQAWIHKKYKHKRKINKKNE